MNLCLYPLHLIKDGCSNGGAFRAHVTPESDVLSVSTKIFSFEIKFHLEFVFIEQLECSVLLPLPAQDP